MSKRIYRLITITALFVIMNSVCSGGLFGSYIQILPGDLKEEDRTKYVDPFIGTKEMGHTFPGACVPFGMVQLSPETDTVEFLENGKYNPKVYRYCSGYQYGDKTIVGFSHTHFSGTGHSDLGDFLIMPTTGRLFLNPGTAENPESGYRSQFNHSEEKASPGYYSVMLKRYGIKAELTATSRVGFHKYTFPKSDSAHIILDMYSGIYNYDGKVLMSYIRVENDTLVTGYRITQGWGRIRHIYFAMSFSKPIQSFGYQNFSTPKYIGFWRKLNQYENFPEMAGTKIKAYFNFAAQSQEAIYVKLAISSVSTQGAIKNLQSEIPGWNFEQVKDEANRKWQSVLSKISIDADDSIKTTFYTSMYHAYISPVVYNDVDGNYRGLDNNIHNINEGYSSSEKTGDKKSAAQNNYSIFSLWDTYRALHPLFTVIEPVKAGEMVQSMVDHYSQSVHKLLPVWSHYSNENWCMIGYHSVSVIADAYTKGIRNFDIPKAFEACLTTATKKSFMGIGEYMKYGFVPMERTGGSVSMTLEYAYDDYAISKFAGALGKKEEEKIFAERSMNYKNVYDKTTKFMRGKYSDGRWQTPMDNPLSTDANGFVEGNAWNYSLYVPHDVEGYIRLLGGENILVERLDSLFDMHLDDKFFENTEDVTRDGMVGGYVQGNEPSHHVPYMYMWTKQPWKTQEKIHRIMNTMYKNAPDGLCGNDDCGQMSAWYIFSALGFYPVCPGSGNYIIGTPLLKKAEINLSDGKKFTVTAEGISGKNFYIQSVVLNGKEWNKPYIPHNMIKDGGNLILKMGSEPQKSWLTDQEIPK